MATVCLRRRQRPRLNRGQFAVAAPGPSQGQVVSPRLRGGHEKEPLAWIA